MFGFTTEIYYDARSYKRQIEHVVTSETYIRKVLGLGVEGATVYHNKCFGRQTNLFQGLYLKKKRYIRVKDT